MENTSKFDINTLKYEFKVDVDKELISYGNIKWCMGNGWATPKKLLQSKFRAATKSNYKKFNEEYSITAKTLSKCINKTIKAVYLKPVEKYIPRYAFNSNGRVSFEKVQLLLDRKKILDQTEKDKLKNIQPLCLYFGKTTEDLKKGLGKSLWKKLCKNSYTKNLYIAKARDTLQGFTLRYSLDLLNKFPSKLLRRGRNIRFSDTGVTSFTEQGLWAYENKSEETLCTDTRRMAVALYKPPITQQCTLKENQFSLKWSAEKMQKKHDQYSLQLQRRREEELLREQREANIVWDSVKPYKDIEFPSVGQYTATLIKTPMELHNEGSKMHHCVGSYKEKIRDSGYLVVSIKKDGERYSTLGLEERLQWKSSKDEKGGLIAELVVTGWTKNQHYKKYNHKVDAEEALQLVNLVVESINEKFKELNKEKD